ncbi:hypothetical protein HaLaN_25151 [Haematococcus lacustris]|uniref:Uncharacterized protein n=1 Tax=Haematococcus lacustris TaxID=44745 RepID=A0A6A0A288_HAELA|nr:hypothetical protein HaLaN_25151 [Haematococcus lacustris]
MAKTSIVSTHTSTHTGWVRPSRPTSAQNLATVRRLPPYNRNLALDQRGLDISAHMAGQVINVMATYSRYRCSEAHSVFRLDAGHPGLGRLGVLRDAALPVVLPRTEAALQHGLHSAGGVSLLVGHCRHVGFAWVAAQPVGVQVRQRVDSALLLAHARQLVERACWLGALEQHADRDSVRVDHLREGLPFVRLDGWVGQEGDPPCSRRCPPACVAALVSAVVLPNFVDKHKVKRPSAPPSLKEQAVQQLGPHCGGSCELPSQWFCWIARRSRHCPPWPPLCRHLQTSCRHLATPSADSPPAWGSLTTGQHLGRQRVA